MSSAKPMQAGMLRRKLVIQRRPATHDPYGFLASSGTDWTTVLTTWGQVQVKQSTTPIPVQGGQQMPMSAYVVTLRYPPSVAIAAGMRVLDGAATYVVQNVVDVNERHRTAVLYCIQAPAPGA